MSKRGFELQAGAHMAGHGHAGHRYRSLAILALALIVAFFWALTIGSSGAGLPVFAEALPATRAAGNS